MARNRTSYQSEYDAPALPPKRDSAKQAVREALRQMELEHIEDEAELKLQDALSQQYEDDAVVYGEYGDVHAELMDQACADDYYRSGATDWLQGWVGSGCDTDTDHECNITYTVLSEDR